MQILEVTPDNRDALPQVIVRKIEELLGISILKRILLYNENDCKATMILKDAIAKLNQ